MSKQTIPYKTVQKYADMLTPVSIFKQLDGERKFLLESSFQHETKGKYSFIGSEPYAAIIGSGNETTVIHYETETNETISENALHYLQNMMPTIDIDLPLPFVGGAIGYVGYDAIRQFVDLGEELEDDLQLPDIHFMLFKNIIVYEHRNDTAHLITINVDHVSESILDERLKRMSDALEQNVSMPKPIETNIKFNTEISKEDFIKKVERAKKHIARGDAQQIVLSQRMVAKMNDDTFSFYRHLRAANPSPYMFYIDFKDYLIIGASPESLVQTSGRDVVTNPIAGTRPRGIDEQDDERLIKELLADKKEVTEHDMLVELSINDLKKVCKEKSITVPVYKTIEKYEHVMHIASEVQGILRDDCTSIDALIACLPAGTVSGAPKERAMQIINTIETKRRGFYAGGIGYISFNRDLNLAIAIRSIAVKNNRAYLQAGAGIIADSIPEMEYLETLQKAKSLMQLNNNLN